METPVSSGGSDEFSELSIDAMDATTPELVIDVDDVDTVNDSSNSDDTSTADDASVHEDEFTHVADSTPRKSTVAESTRILQESDAAADDSETDTDEDVGNTKAVDETNNTSGNSDDGSIDDSEHSRDANRSKSLSQTESDIEHKADSTCSPNDQAITDPAPIGETLAKNTETTNDAVPVLSFHSDAEDLYLDVQDAGKHVFYHVLAANFASASPTWRQIIYGGKYPRPDTGKWVIEMLDDDSYGLGVLLSVVHYQFDTIPERPTISELYRIALVADKYKCVHLLRPYFKAWLDNLHRQLVLTDSHTGEDNKVLYITWAAGDLRWFPKILHHVIGQATVSPDGSLLDSQGQKWDASQLPYQIIGK